MKRYVCLLLTVLLIFGELCLPAAAAGGGEAELTASQTYVQGMFSDVSAAAWYADSVAIAYSYGLLQGSGERFAPDEGLTLAETLALACRLHSQYTGGSGVLDQGEPWYQVYVDYALSNGILKYAYTDYTAAASRAEFVQILSAAVPDTALEDLNTVADGAVADVPMSAGYAGAVYRFYRAGILSGSGGNAAFQPASGITRAEAAAILARIADPDRRVRLTLDSGETAETPADGGVLTGAQIYDQCSPSVCYIELYD